eukprot:GDKH01005047.1.p7 GENE.GDKH01005047.1~~GDKH01005047.1.p7  ORF type:complete len:58 (-),score=13.31 GDKH01005047.1:16-189(-)
MECVDADRCCQAKAVRAWSGRAAGGAKMPSEMAKLCMPMHIYVYINVSSTVVVIMID